MKKNGILAVVLFFAAACTLFNSGGHRPGAKIRINDELYYVYSFDKKPSMGIVILKVSVFDNAGTRRTNLAITGSAGMPAMGGSHDSGEIMFQQNTAGDYLLPVNVAMPGEWEVQIIMEKDHERIFNDAILFTVK